MEIVYDRNANENMTQSSYICDRSLRKERIMSLSNIFGWSKKDEQPAGTACGTACGAADKPDEQPAACGSACGAGDKPEEKPAACGTACGAGDKPEEKPAACGTACGAADK